MPRVVSNQERPRKQGTLPRSPALAAEVVHSLFRAGLGARLARRPPALELAFIHLFRTDIPDSFPDRKYPALPDAHGFWECGMPPGYGGEN